MVQHVLSAIVCTEKYTRSSKVQFVLLSIYSML